MAATIYEPLSTAHLKSCAVDFDSRPDKKAVNLVQYDQTIPVLCVSLKKGGTEYKVPSDADVNIRMDKRDGYHVYNPALGVNAERTIAYFAVTPQMSTGWGDYYPIVEITVGGGIAGSAPIWLHFDRNPLPENAIISSDEYKTIQQLLEDVKAVKADTEAIKTATEQIKAQTEAVRDQAKGFADNAKNSADKAQTLVDGMPSDYSQAMKDIGTLKNQMQRAYPDDSTIGENTWSSKNIVDMLCPEIKESGNPVVCYPVAGYPLGVKASWEPVQEGSGTPYPAGGGKNQLNPAEYEAATKTVNGITFTRSNTGEVVVNGTATGTAIYVLIKSFSYIISLSTDRNWSIVGENVISAQGLVSGVTVIRPSDNTSLYIRVESGATVKTTVQPQIEKGNTPTAWEPYENIRPIKGRDSVTVERCGENLVKFPYSTTSAANKNGLVFTSQQDGSITVDGTATADTWYLVEGGIEKRLPMNTPIALSGCPAGGSIGSYYIGLYLGGTWFSDAGNGNTNIKLTTRKIRSRVEISIVKGTVCNNLTFYPKIEVGTTITPYSKYQGSTNTLTLPETVYGGEVDARTGEGQETWRLLNNPSSYNYYEGKAEGGWVQSEGAIAWFLYDPKSFPKKAKVLSNIFNVVSNIANTVSPYTIGGKNNYIAFRLPRSVAATSNDVKNWLASNGVEIAFNPITQTPFTATGAQPIPALAGTNTVLTDADSATVTGRADPIKRIEDLEAAVASIN